MTLQHALEQVQSSTLRDRADGLANVRHVLQRNRNSSSISALDDLSLHKIYDVLFGVAIQEKSAWLKAKTKTTQSAAEGRLSTCASALRLAVDVGVRTLKFKTVRALLDHIIDTLPTPENGFCTPLALDYARALVAVLGYQAHVEHFVRKEWGRVAAFCVQMMEVVQAEATEDDDAVPGAASRSRIGVADGQSYQSSRSYYKDSAGSQGIRPLSRLVAEEMLTALCLLTAAPNAPIRDHAATLLWPTVEYLKTSSSGGRNRAFIALGHIFMCTRTEDISLTKKVSAHVLRLVRHFWSQKNDSLNDEMLKCLLYLRPFIAHSSAGDEGAIIRTELSALLEVWRFEYCKRLDRDLLQMDDLRLVVRKMGNHHESTSVDTAIFALRDAGPKAERDWTLVSLMAFCCKILGSKPQRHEDPESDEDNEDGPHRPRKKQRRSSALDDLLTLINSGPASSKVCGLQTVAFLAQQGALSYRELTQVIDAAFASCSDDNGTIATWAFLVLASCASLRLSADVSLASRWASTWQVASRALGNTSVCRAACHLLNMLLQLRLVSTSSVPELVRSIVGSMELNGPSVLADSVLRLLWQLAKASQQLSPVNGNATAEVILSWLFRMFAPSQFEDKAHAANHVLYNVPDLLRLVEVCLNHPFSEPTSPMSRTWSSVAQAWLVCENQHDLVRYLLLSRNDDDFQHQELTAADDIERTPATMSPARLSCEALLLTYLSAEVHKHQALVQQCFKERPTSVSLDMFAFICVSCVAMCDLANCHTYRDSRRQAQLQKQAEALLKTICDFVQSVHCGQDKVDIMLSIFSQVFTGLSGDENVFGYSTSRCETVVCKTLSATLAARRSAMDFNGQAEDDDLMDMDDADDSQESRTHAAKTEVLELKSEHAVTHSALANRSRITLYISAVAIQSSDKGLGEASGYSSSRMMDFILALPNASIFACQDVIGSCPQLGIDFVADDATRLLEFYADTCLSSYAYNRSEVAMGTILKTMARLIPLWTDRGNDKLFGLGVDIYSWFTSTALDAGVLSPTAQKALADLLLRLWHATNADYPNEADEPSVRTSLFNLLKRGTVAAQFHLSGHISSIFGLFVLTAHTPMFDDLQQSLPAEADWLEGIAIRLLFFARLGSAWHSLLRECVYYIFETAGRVKQSSQHAAHCISQLASALKSKSGKDVFRLFAPQLLHTWLESYTLSSLPFAAFSYDSLNDMLCDNQVEVTAQLLMRGKDDALHALTSALKTDAKDISRNAFAKCAAYTISWDISQPKKDPSGSTSESKLRAILGKQDYNTLLVQHFPAIVAQFYLSMQQDDIQDEWLARKAAYKTAAKAMEQVHTFGYSTRPVPTSQQPSFKSKYLCDQVERLCRRTSHDAVMPWEVSSLSLAIRVLLDNIDDALGPLHMCVMLRKLRVVICMSAPVSFTEYPLEMLLRSIRPFMSDSQCADDAIGIVHYLLQHGHQYLIEHSASFMNGYVALLILQMRQHFGTLHDSTTQESQHKATLQQMESLCTWLVKYGRSNRQLPPKDGSDDVGELYASLDKVRLPGNARVGSPESALMRLLLKQQNAEKPVLSPADGLEALLLLTGGFEAPKSIVEDCLGDDVEAAGYAHSLSQVLGKAHFDDRFVLWASAVLGRAFVSTGVRPNFCRPDSKFLRIGELKGVVKSQAVIANRVIGVLESKGRFEAGLAEYTLRQLPSTFYVAEELLAFEQMLPAAVVPAVAEGNYGYQPFAAAGTTTNLANRASVERALELSPLSVDHEWSVELCSALCSVPKKLPILPALSTMLSQVDGFAIDLLAPIVHIVLANEMKTDTNVKEKLSAAIATHLTATDEAMRGRQRTLLELLLYLRSQPYPGENTKVDRLRWLDVDPLLAATTASRCGMPTAALMFAESAAPVESMSRRGSTRASMSQLSAVHVPGELLISIFKQLDEPDSFYGVEQSASLESVLERLDFEGDGFKSLMFRSAKLDSEMRTSNHTAPADSAGVIRSLSALNLNSLTYALLSQTKMDTTTGTESMLEAARKLEQWDVASPGVPGQAATCFKVFQELSRTTSQIQTLSSLQSALLSHVSPALSDRSNGVTSYAWCGVLASLTEMSELLSVSNESQIASRWQQMQARQSWMHSARYEDCQMILSNRQTFFSVMSRNDALLQTMHIGLKQSRALEMESLLALSKFARDQGVLQEALSAATHCSHVAEQCKDIGVSMTAAAKLETAKVLWAASEAAASVRMLRELADTPKTEAEMVPVGHPGLLAQLAHQLAEARLESAEEVLGSYLKPAIKSLGGRNKGAEAGNVFYEFATFCDQQLQNPGNLEDFTRMAQLRQKRAQEIKDLQELIGSAKKSGQDKFSLEKSLMKAKQWFGIDNAEYLRLKASRDTFVQQSLQNYLLALHASNSHDICALRLFALWLENAEAENADAIIERYLPNVPSWKFVVLLNQLMSRLENNDTRFQTSLKALLRRICAEHPYHSLHHLFAASRRPGSKDGAANSRFEAATKIRATLSKEAKFNDLMSRVFKANRDYDSFARCETPHTRSDKIALSEFAIGDQLASTIPTLRVPPVTIGLPLQADGDYSGAPVIVKVHSAVSLMAGASRPKTLTVTAADGKGYKQLFKSSPNDDLRQDAIMEQVFEEVSGMLRKHKQTRQRNLHINTYKVIPLTSTSGVLEWVPNSIPIDRFLRPAHSRYHPQDMRPDEARDKIKEVMNSSVDARVKAYQNITKRMQPVMRHFFLERFDNPDEWFEKRTAYTRTTASISMLGHVLGLGDRHCQNIVLDEKSGEVVHIDLGVAFEAGRVLTVPELVPFRLTRDIVDGMGITKTEGVFRRCCEFTMDALREDKDTIMTLLNVLRYDPLYTWTLSPLRAKKVQDQETGNNIGGADEPASSKKEHEAGEADRALSIVEKKLGKTLSTAATVNELIQQAVDEKNLARLYVGWSAYF